MKDWEARNPLSLWSRVRDRLLCGPTNRVGWLFLVAGLALGLSGLSTSYGPHALVAAPGSLPAGRAFAWLANWIWVIQVAMLAFLLLLFPTGQPRSRRWRPAAWLVGGALALVAVDMLVNAARIWLICRVIVRRQDRGNRASITCMIRHYVARRAKVIEDHPHNGQIRIALLPGRRTGPISSRRSSSRWPR